MRYVFLIICICFSMMVRSQPGPSEGAFFEHTVEAGQTLYSISKKYNLTVDRLVADNPGADVSLKVGQKLRIAKNVDAAPAQGVYVVKAGDTYYGISRAYGITVDELKALNNGMPSGLIPGDTIVVPAEKPSALAPRKESLTDAQGFYDIAVMLPFYTSTKDSLVSRDIRLREAAVHMYRGIMAAADSLEAIGMKARIRVFDVLDNKSSIHATLKKKEMNGVDLIIGPLFKDVVPEVAAWCLANGAHMVVPVQQPNRILLNAPSLSKAVPGAVTQWMSIARYATQKFARDNVVLIDSKILDDRKLVESFKEEWFKITKDSLKKVVVCDDLANLKLTGMFPSGKCLVAVPTADKKVIAAVFKSLGSRSDIEVIGLESWDDLEAISTDMRNRFHVSFPKQVFADAKDPRTRRWQENYRKKFKSEPVDFSYTGYDVLLYHGAGLFKFGSSFPDHWNEIGAKPIGSKFDFFRTSAESGFENAFIHIMRTDNYQIYRAN